MSKPREFWIWDNGEMPCHAFTEEDMDETLPLNKLVHVIEYSAYAALEEKLRVAVEALEFYITQGEFRPYRVSSSDFIVHDYGYTARVALTKFHGASNEEQEK